MRDMAQQGPSAAEQLEELKEDYDRLRLQSEMHGAMAVGLEVFIFPSMSSKCGTHKTFRTRFWLWLSGKSP